MATYQKYADIYKNRLKQREQSLEETRRVSPRKFLFDLFLCYFRIFRTIRGMCMVRHMVCKLLRIALIRSRDRHIRIAALKKSAPPFRHAGDLVELDPRRQGTTPKEANRRCLRWGSRSKTSRIATPSRTTRPSSQDQIWRPSRTEMPTWPSWRYNWRESRKPASAPRMRRQSWTPWAQKWARTKRKLWIFHGF